jgi:hypothetical protein
MPAAPSLLIVPYRSKTGKLYSQIPTSGAGDFTVTRNTTATRFNSAGLIESVASGIPRLDYFTSGGTAGCPALLVEPAATNLALQSEAFNVSGTWVGSANSASLYLWGAQLETGSVATSYIPTTTGTASRSADVISVSGAVSGSIGQTEGTMYFEVSDVKGVITGTGNPALMIRNSAFTNWIGLTSNSVAAPFRITVKSTITTLINYTSAISEGKVAIAYSASGAVVYVNGIEVATTATNPNFTFNIVSMEQYMPFKVKSLALYTTRLTNAELQSLTTL